MMRSCLRCVWILVVCLPISGCSGCLFDIGEDRESGEPAEEAANNTGMEAGEDMDLDMSMTAPDLGERRCPGMPEMLAPATGGQELGWDEPYLDTIVARYEFLEEDEECCEDFNGNDEPDDAMREIFQFSGVVEDTEREMNERIAVGLERKVFRIEGWNRWPSDSDVTLTVREAEDSDQSLDPTERNPYVTSTEDTMQRLPSAVLRDGRFVSDFDGELDLPLTILSIPGTVRVRNVKIDAELLGEPREVGDSGLRLEGVLSGTLSVADYFEAINETVREECECFGLGDELLIATPTGDVSDASCQITREQAALTCPSSSRNNRCLTILDGCPLVGSLPFIADVETECLGFDCGARGTCDAFSFSLRFVSYPAMEVGP